MQPRKIKPEPNITEAAEKTGLLIRGLQSRLLEGVGEVQEDPGDTTTDLENQLQAYFAGWPGEQSSVAATRIRSRVIDGVAERILRGWQHEGKGNPFEHEVVERPDRQCAGDMLLANGNGALGGGPEVFPHEQNRLQLNYPATRCRRNIEKTEKFPRNACPLFKCRRVRHGNQNSSPASAERQQPAAHLGRLTCVESRRDGTSARGGGSCGS